jgi:hypothetical protein
VIYCRTGEANLSVDSYAGVGIYRTDNGGETWELPAALSETDIRNFTPLTRRMQSEDLDVLLGAWIFTCKEIIENRRCLLSRTGTILLDFTKG